MTSGTVTETGDPARKSSGQGGVPHNIQAHIPALDGLRGFAASAVAIGHIRLNTGLGPVHEQLGTYAVLLFFILSGFLMGHLYLTQPFDSQRLRSYFAARISRIVPLYYAVGLLSFLYSRIDSEFYYYMTPVAALRHLVMFDNVSVFWTVAPEFQFYFLFPAIWWLLTRPPRVALPLGCFAGLITAALIAYRYQLPGLMVISKLHIFLLGVGIAAFAPHIRRTLKLGVATLVQVGALAILFSLIAPPTVSYYNWLYLEGVENKLARFYYEFPRVFMMGFCVMAFALADTHLSRIVFGNAFARRLGKYSFSIYLLHTPIIYIGVQSGLVRILPEYTFIAAILFASYVASASSYRWFEEPARVASRNALLRMFNSLVPGSSKAALRI